MKEKIFEFMRDVQGWNLYDNNFEDFNKILQHDNSYLEKQYMKFDALVDNNKETTLSVDEIEQLRDAIGFIIDYVYASNAVDNEEKAKQKHIIDVKGALDFYIESELNCLEYKDLLTEEDEKYKELLEKTYEDDDAKNNIAYRIIDDSELSNEFDNCLNWYITHQD